MATMALIDLRPKSWAMSALLMTTLARLCTYTIFLASCWAPRKPELYSRISVMNTESGTTIEMGLKSDLRFIGRSDRPA